MRRSTESEIIVLGSFFLDPSLFTVAVDAGLTGNSFTPGLNAHIWEAVRYFSERGEDIGELTVCSYIKSNGYNCSYQDIVDLTNRVETTSSFKHSL